MSRGQLRVYLGAAPGVGKTYAMLDEGTRRRSRGADVVVAVVESHGRRATEEMLGDLEVVPRRSVEHRGTVVTEMDLDAVLLRRPDVALVDELAHTNAPGSRHEKRFSDIEELLAAGIDVISTVNVQHLESVNDVVERITGVRQQETVPDEWVRRADQVELVDMTPEALRRRMAHGNVYPADRIDAALSNYFRPGNLAAFARARAAVGRRPGRGPAAGLSGSARDRRDVGDPRTGHRGVDGSRGQRADHPPSGPHRRSHRRRPARGARGAQRRQSGRRRRSARPPPRAAHRAGRHLPRGRGRRRGGHARGGRPRRAGDAGRDRIESTHPSAGARGRVGRQRPAPACEGPRRARDLDRRGRVDPAALGAPPPSGVAPTSRPVGLAVARRRSARAGVPDGGVRTRVEPGDRPAAGPAARRCRRRAGRPGARSGGRTGRRDDDELPVRRADGFAGGRPPPQRAVPGRVPGRRRDGRDPRRPGRPPFRRGGALDAALRAPWRVPQRCWPRSRTRCRSWWCSCATRSR